ncbi:MAG: hypothetical protein ACKVOH_06680 [Chlamydiales bacterium]
MKRVGLAILTILTCGMVHALPVGNPSEASLLIDGLFWEGQCPDICDPNLTWCDAISIRVGFLGDYIFNRYLEINSNNKSKDADKTRVMTNAGYFAANFWDRVDVFATLGASSIFQQSDFGTIANRGPGALGVVAPSGDAIYQLWTNTDFSWSVGLRGPIWECGCTSVGAEFQYFQARPKLRYINTYSGPNAQVPLITSDTGSRQAFGNGYTTKYYDWKVGLGISHRIYNLVPYAAVTCSNAKWLLGNAVIRNQYLFGVPPQIAAQAIPFSTVLQDQRAAKTWGYALGVTLVDCEKMSLNLEGDFASSLEVAINAQIRF